MSILSKVKGQNVLLMLHFMHCWKDG